MSKVTLKSMTLAQARNALNAPEGQSGRLELVLSNDKTKRRQCYRIHSALRPFAASLRGWKAQGVKITGEQARNYPKGTEIVTVRLPRNITEWNEEARAMGARKRPWGRVWAFKISSVEERVNIFSLVAAYYGDRDPAPAGAHKVDSLFAVDKARGQQLGWITTDAETGRMTFQASAIAKAVARHRPGTQAHLDGFGWLTKTVQAEGTELPGGVRIERTERCVRCGRMLTARDGFSRAVLMGTGGHFDAEKGHWTSCAGQDPERFIRLAQATGDASVIRQATKDYARYTGRTAVLEPAVLEAIADSPSPSPSPQVEAATTDEERRAQLKLAGQIAATQKDRAKRSIEKAEAVVVQDMLADEAAATTQAAAQVGRRIARRANIGNGLSKEMAKPRPAPAKRIRAGVDEFTAADRQLEIDNVPWDVDEAIAKAREGRFSGLDLD